MKTRLVILLALLYPALAGAEALPGIISPAKLAAAEHEGRAALQDALLAHAKQVKAANPAYTDAQIKWAQQPAMVHKGTFVQKLWDGTHIEFPWYRIGYAENALANTSKVSAKDAAKMHETNKGGLRRHYGVNESEVRALALKMDTKLALTGDAVGGFAIRGAKGGIGAGRVIKVGRHYQAKLGDIVDPAPSVPKGKKPVFKSQRQMQLFADAYVKAGGKVGLGYDIQAGDYAVKGPELWALAQRYLKHGQMISGVSGKPLLANADKSIDPKGGIKYRETSTGDGVWMSARLAAHRVGLKVRDATVVSQGLGEVGLAFARSAAKDGAAVIGVQERFFVEGKPVVGMLMNPAGSKAKPRHVKAFVDDAAEIVAKKLDPRTYKGGVYAKHFRPGVDASEIKADVVGLNALGGVLNRKTVPRYVRSGTTQGKRKIIAEGANLAETSRGARMLDWKPVKSNLLVITGDLANFGGVHISNVEAVQNNFREVVSSGIARKSLTRAVQSSWRQASRLASAAGLSERSAIERLAADGQMRRAHHMKGAPMANLEKRVINPTTIRTRQPKSPWLAEVYGTTNRPLVTSVNGGARQVPARAGRAAPRRR